jgi:hypothetical protein
VEGTTAGTAGATGGDTVTTTTTTTTRNAPDTARVPATRPLLTCGVLAGPIYVGTSLVQAFTRPGFDLSRHSWSLLANGDLGFVQVTNLVLSGALLVAFAAGLRYVLAGGRGRTWAPALVAVFGLSMIVAGAFRADPVAGFPVGTPEGATQISTHGLVHFAAGAVGFTCVAAACLVLGSRYAAARRPGMAWFCRVTGVVFLLAFAARASSGGSAGATLGFVTAIVLLFTCIATVASDALRTALRTV